MVSRTRIASAVGARHLAEDPGLHGAVDARDEDRGRHPGHRRGQAEVLAEELDEELRVPSAGLLVVVEREAAQGGHQHRAAIGDHVEVGVHRRGDERLEALDPLGGRDEAVAEPVELAVAQLAEQLGGVVEVRVGEGLAHPGGGGDALHRDRGRTPLDQQRGRAVEELVPSLVPPQAGPATGAFRLGPRRHHNRNGSGCKPAFTRTLTQREHDELDGHGRAATCDARDHALRPDDRRPPAAEDAPARRGCGGRRVLRRRRHGVRPDRVPRAARRPAWPRELDVLTGVAVAFPRSPMVTAEVAWELAELTEGRFRLGLGTQVRAHIERRYGSDFEHPGPRLREYVEALRAIFAVVPRRRAARPRRRVLAAVAPARRCGRPGPIDAPDPPIDLAAVNPWMLRMAGEVADGVHVHPLNTPTYLRETVLPELAAGAAPQRSDRGRPRGHRAHLRGAGLDARGGAGLREMARVQVAFYGSTPELRVHLRPDRPPGHDRRASASGRRPETSRAWPRSSTTTSSSTSA